MDLTRLARWIDRDLDIVAGGKPPLLILICLAAWVPLMLVGWSPATASIAVVWGLLWVGLYVWRFPAFVRRLEARTAGRDKRKRRP
jgi:hypothetical protein